ncbi:MAG TPA: sugar ABC transporter permease [Thermomicrobiales bacterium]|nr:sugar ABC transporter permease [Thermomicrobiales bacterium]
MAIHSGTAPQPLQERAEDPAKAYHTPKRGVKWFAGKEWLLFLLFIFPNFFFLFMFTYWPLWENVKLSLQQTDLLAFSGTPKYVGMENYEWLFGNRTFRYVVQNTVIFIVSCVGLTLIFGLSIALLLNERLKLRNGVRALVFAPYLLSGAAIGIVWAYIFDPRFGLLAQILDWFSIPSPHWLDRPAWALPAIIIVYVWKNLGFAVVIFLAGLQGIPKDLYDAAKVDGAGPWWRFKSVTLPMLSPISFFLMVTSVLATFQAFDIQQVMTAGGPAYATTTLVYYVYEQSFGQGANFGRAAAAAIILFLSMLVITAIQMFYTEKKVHYDG